MTLKALVIQNDQGKIVDLGDLLSIARAEGQKIFSTKENVNIVEVFHSHTFVGYVVVVKYTGRTKSLAKEVEEEKIGENKR